MQPPAIELPLTVLPVEVLLDDDVPADEPLIAIWLPGTRPVVELLAMEMDVPVAVPPPHIPEPDCVALEPFLTAALAPAG
jgi:hypothetical protein